MNIRKGDTTLTAIDPAPSLGLLTDLYQLTMAAGYWKTGLAERESVFHLFFRKCPFRGGYAVAAGLEQALEFLSRCRFSEQDLTYLATLTGNDGKPLFEDGFLEELSRFELACDLDAIPEGTVVFPHQPLLRVRGPLAQCQILETPLLTLLNFQTLIATKAARICQAAEGDAVVEFGLRRAQGLDGGLSASRAAFIGGCVGTSNVLAGRRFGIPVMGTHAHSWVTSFESEAESFDAYARALPNNCTFLVDTYDTLTGVGKAIDAGRELRQRGYEMAGIRLDSGDLRSLSIDARDLLDEAGFPNASIVASNDLDEYRITELKAAGARINVWGVGTRLSTAYDQPALGGVYKLAAYREGDDHQEGSAWRGVIKLSEDEAKISNPGVQQVRRFSDDSGFLADVIYDETRGIEPPTRFKDRAGVEHAPPPSAESYDLLVPVVRAGLQVYEGPALENVRARTAEQIAKLPESVQRLQDPETYRVGLEAGLHQVKSELIAASRRAIA